MAIWATLYLELWKRYSANITHRWGMTGFSYKAEHPRPEYLARLQSSKRKKLNVVTRVLEPSVPYWQRKFPIYLFSYTVVLLFVSSAFP
jgi:anoctamin-1